MTILSICIPTYNRVSTIESNISYLVSKVYEKKLSKIIEILVSDNSDNQNYALKEIEKKNIFFKYFHKSNQGLDYNILNLANKAKGDFIWFCQDHSRIRFEQVNKIINLLKNQDPDYIFLPTKDQNNYEDLILTNKKLISIKSIYLNTNLVKKKKFLKYYNNLVNKFNGSALVFMHSIIYMCHNTDLKNIIIFGEKCSDYKYFFDIQTYSKTTWSNNLRGYTTILQKSSEMFLDIKSIKNLNYQNILSLLSKYEHGFASLYQLKILQVKSKFFSHSDKKLKYIYDHPSFNKPICKFFVKTILEKKLSFFIVNKLFLVELFYMFFSPKTFFERFKRKFFN